MDASVVCTRGRRVGFFPLQTEENLNKDSSVLGWHVKTQPEHGSTISRLWPCTLSRMKGVSRAWHKSILGLFFLIMGAMWQVHSIFGCCDFHPMKDCNLELSGQMNPLPSEWSCSGWLFCHSNWKGSCDVVLAPAHDCFLRLWAQNKETEGREEPESDLNCMKCMKWNCIREGQMLSHGKWGSARKEGNTWSLWRDWDEESCAVARGYIQVCNLSSPML